MSESFFLRLIAVALLLGLAMAPAVDAEAQGRSQVLPELQIYVGAHTVIDYSHAELVENFPELEKALEFSEDQSLLPELLQKVGKSVEDFFQYLPNTASVEDVRQEVRRSDGRVVDRTSGKYQYLMLSGTSGNVGLDEFRSNSDGKEISTRGPVAGFMQTTRCVWHLVHFHPRYQADSRFRYVGMSSKPKAYVIAFAQKPESARQVGQIGVWDPELAGRKVWMLIQGLVWVDPENYQVVRARTELLAPRYDIGLARNSTEIDCSTVQFEGVDQTFWLPQQVVITTIFRNFTYRNRHRYSDYRIFSVVTQEKIIPPVPPQ